MSGKVIEIAYSLIGTGFGFYLAANKSELSMNRSVILSMLSKVSYVLEILEDPLGIRSLLCPLVPAFLSNLPDCQVDYRSVETRTRFEHPVVRHRTSNHELEFQVLTGVDPPGRNLGGAK